MAAGEFEADFCREFELDEKVNLKRNFLGDRAEGKERSKKKIIYGVLGIERSG
jgi:hypothetical protein